LPDQTVGLCQQITACVEDVAKWTSANCLQLNVAKTEFLWCSSRQRIDQLPASPVLISGNSVDPASVVCNLEVWIDCGLSMSTHVTKVASGCFVVLHQLYGICRSVSQESLIALVVSLVLTWLDYCNAVLVGLPAYQLDRLQSAINAAARMIYRTSWYDQWSRHITAEQASLVASAWENSVQALCTCVQVSEQQWTGLPCWQSTASDGCPVTSTSAVIFVVNASCPGDTSCNTGRPFVSSCVPQLWPPEHWTPYRTSSWLCLTSHCSLLRWRHICSHIHSNNWQHTSH